MSEAVKAAVIGDPVAHSKSPLIHRHWLDKYQQQGSYEALDVKPENLEEAVHKLVAEGYAGFNVTLPHKEAVLELCDILDITAEKIGAVNTVVIQDGKLHGMNTDIFGFLENIEQNAPDFSLSHGPAVVLGAGGAARAVIEALLAEDVPRIYLCNRTRGRAIALAQSCSDPKRVELALWEKRSHILGDAHFLVNTTNLGMAGNAPLEIDLQQLSQDALVHDIVYAPLHTGLLLQAEERGLQILTGIGMLLHQARPAFQRWFGIMPEIDDVLKEKVLT